MEGSHRHFLWQIQGTYYCHFKRHVQDMVSDKVQALISRKDSGLMVEGLGWILPPLMNVGKLLLGANAEKDKATDTGGSPMFIAWQEGHSKVVRLFFLASADKEKIMAAWRRLSVLLAMP